MQFDQVLLNRKYWVRIANFLKPVRQYHFSLTRPYFILITQGSRLILRAGHTFLICKISYYSKILKAYFFMKPAKRSLVYLGGKIVFEFWPLRQCWAVGPIQI